MGKLDVGASRVGLCDDGGVAVFRCEARHSYIKLPSTPSARDSGSGHV
jgi:hypothetical protein